MEPDVPELDMMIPEVRCGDGQIGEGENCDDGNSITETCPYGVRSCRVCDAQCRDIGGEVAFCGDGQISHHERCDDGLANSDALPYACRTDCHPDRRALRTTADQYGQPASFCQPESLACARARVI